MNFAFGILLLVSGGLLEGIFTLGIKKTPNWNWEHIWGLGSLIALLFMSWPLALLTIPNLAQVYSTVPANTIVITVLFALGWGIGGIFFGLGVNAVGLALGISLLMSINSVCGSAGPLLILNPEAFLQPSGIALMIGLVIMIMGIVVCALAGKRKDVDLASKKENSQQTSIRPQQKSFLIGLIFCILGGSLASLLNYAFIFGDEIKSAAITAGAKSVSAANAIWSIVFTINYLVNVLYCIYLVNRNKSARQFIENSELKYWLWALFLGIAWPLGIILYGISVDKLGSFGAYAGFPMLLICSILGSNIVGALIGEWRGVSDTPKRMMIAGVSILVIAAAIFAYANSIKGVV